MQNTQCCKNLVQGRSGIGQLQSYYVKQITDIRRRWCWHAATLALVAAVVKSALLGTWKFEKNCAIQIPELGIIILLLAYPSCKWNFLSKDLTLKIPPNFSGNEVYENIHLQNM